jgi:hypothetical protein
MLKIFDYKYLKKIESSEIKFSSNNKFKNKKFYQKSFI